ncbi:UbiA family prenyltransferase [Halococcus saccharolyticus]|uniref:UbiA prenyltransferase n=1 Tax=Halococcus saccharolyticus DSM 5350 TaxID=1227455 RepID=M0MJ21_9EURY|nr:UbiA family prenyltransferase [Halococcus saccharolyticus]EMA44729.1 UbiA prenyltransferase [Halococcus saccharolyticus DSM 5350]
MAVGESGLSERFTTYASLVRVPNLFSAPPDVLLGAALASAAGAAVSLPALAGLCLAAVLLYAGGTTLNDYFDAPIDRSERPERPIPSGEVTRRTAGALGGSLLVVGVALTFVAAGTRAGAIAAGLAAVIALYDGALKGGPVGFLAMGGARGLNVLLGTAAAGAVDFPTWTLAVPAVVVLYIAAVTYMAANEATATPRKAVATAAAGVVVAAATVFAVIATVGPPTVQAGLAAGLVAGFLAWTGRALEPAYADPRPRTVGPAVGTCVLALVVLDAAFAAIVGVGWALAVLVFLVPAVGLARLFDVS